MARSQGVGDEAARERLAAEGRVLETRAERSSELLDRLLIARSCAPVGVRVGEVDRDDRRDAPPFGATRRRIPSKRLQRLDGARVDGITVTVCRRLASCFPLDVRLSAGRTSIPARLHVSRQLLRREPLQPLEGAALGQNDVGDDA